MPQYAAQGANGHLSVVGNDDGPQAEFVFLDEFDVAASLRRLGETCCHKPACHLPVWQWAKEGLNKRPILPFPNQILTPQAGPSP